MTHKQFSAKGGKAGTGEAKARTSEQARAAVQARWKKHRKTKRVTAKPNAPSSGRRRMKAHDCKLDAPAALPEAHGSDGRPCVSCGAKATLSNYDGDYCKDCMQLHILEKMFVNLTALQGKRHE